MGACHCPMQQSKHSVTTRNSAARRCDLLTTCATRKSTQHTQQYLCNTRGSTQVFATHKIHFRIPPESMLTSRQDCRRAVNGIHRYNSGEAPPQQHRCCCVQEHSISTTITPVPEAHSNLPCSNAAAWPAAHQLLRQDHAPEAHQQQQQLQQHTQDSVLLPLLLE